KLTLEGGIPESPKDLDRLECLEKLNLLSTKITHLPDSICKLKHLKDLKLDPYWFLEKLPQDLGRLECLEKLILSECVILRHIPDSICNMKLLQYFLLPGCIAIEKLPEEIGRLKCLRELNIEGTNIRHLPESIFELRCLRIVGYRLLLQSYGLTSPIQTAEDETFFYVELILDNVAVTRTRSCSICQHRYLVGPNVLMVHHGG
ncbi:Leucine-rich repeat-containing protein, partial [Cynara cardunculus var. scolymus]